MWGQEAERTLEQDWMAREYSLSSCDPVDIEFGAAAYAAWVWDASTFWCDNEILSVQL
jgi:hypothetical protein